MGSIVNIIDINEKRLTKFRQQLHQNPELSGKEFNTPDIILDFLSADKPDKVIKNLGGTGMALIYDGQQPGPCVVFRCELDALPIHESNDLSYRSKEKGVAHKCGHDGHMAIVTGLGMLLAQRRPPKGKVVLLYQPAEETGEGAERILRDARFQAIKPDYIFALHNLPGFAKGSIIFKEGVFASASRGMVIKLHGATSHAAEPENGRSPALAMSAIINGLANLPDTKTYEAYTLVTVVHALLGEIAFGTTPGYAEIRATLRSNLDDDLKILSGNAIMLVEKLACQYQLGHEISWTEEFSETSSNGQALNIIRKAAGNVSAEIIEFDTIFRWSEDFGAYSKKIKAGFFGLGAGVNSPDLHNAHYDFSDEITRKGVEMFYSICEEILG